VWDRGGRLHKADLAINDETVEKYLLEGISNVTALALGAGIPTAATLPDRASRTPSRSCLAASIATDYEFKSSTAREAASGREGRQARRWCCGPPLRPPQGSRCCCCCTRCWRQEGEGPGTRGGEDFGMGGLF